MHVIRVFVLVFDQGSGKSLAHFYGNIPAEVIPNFGRAVHIRHPREADAVPSGEPGVLMITAQENGPMIVRELS